MTSNVVSDPDRAAATARPARRKRGSKQSRAPQRKASARRQRDTELLTFTMDPITGRILKFEGLDARGARRELSGAEKAILLSRGVRGSIERVIERAFEAGIACVLEGDCGLEERTESAEDVELAHRLLTPLIERSNAGSLLAPDVLERAILDTLIVRALTVASGDETVAHE